MTKTNVGKELRQWFHFYRRLLRLPAWSVSFHANAPNEIHLNLDDQPLIAYIEVDCPSTQVLVGYEPYRIKNPEETAAHEVTHWALIRPDDYAEHHMTPEHFKEFHRLLEESVETVAGALIRLRKK